PISLECVPGHRRSPIGPALLVVIAAISQEVGAANAVGLFAALGAIGAVFVRFLVAGVILCVAVRPRLRGLSSRAWLSAAALAATLTVMNLCFYNSLTRIPLGVAVTVEALGPLALSVVVSQRKTSWLWALLALLGVALLSLTGVRVGHLAPVGLGFAAAAAASWGGLHSGHSASGIRLPQPRRAGSCDRDRRIGHGPLRGRGVRTARRSAVAGTGAGGDRRRDVLGDSLLTGVHLPSPPPAGDVRDLDVSFASRGSGRGLGDPWTAPRGDGVCCDRIGDRG